MATINTSQLTNTNISDTYLGVLHARGVPLSATGQTKIHDGSGEVSALALGRQNNGMSVTGLLSGNAIIKGNSLVANELTMPRVDTGNSSDIVIRSGAGTLALSGFSNVFNSVFNSYPDGVYVNPKITVSNGLITNIESSPSVVMLSATASIYSFTGDVNSLISNTYPTITDNNWRSPSGGLDRIISWPTFNTELNTARYAIITSDVFLQSNGGDFQIECILDNKVISTGIVREDHRFYGVDSLRNTNQQFIIIPNTKTSSFTFRVKTLPGSNDTSLNQCNVFITLDGWIY